MLEISRKYTYLPEVVVSSAGSSTTRAARHKMEKKNRSRIYDLGVIPTRGSTQNGKKNRSRIYDLGVVPTRGNYNLICY
jgi:hypothetical protein